MIAAALAEQGASVPTDLKSADVWPVSAPYREAFAVLSASRGHSEVGPAPIPYSDLITYAHENGFCDSITEQQEFVLLVQAQDREYLLHSAKERERKMKERVKS